MSFDVTNSADAASRKTQIEPTIILEIDGVSTLFGARIIEKRVKIGDVGLEIGNFVIGGLNAVTDQSSLVSFDDSTSRITQSINPDRGISQSISSMKIALIDKDLEITELITPDDSVSPVFDLLGRKAKVWLGFKGTAWKDDFIIIFRGVIDDIMAGPGLITLNLAHPSTKARSEVFQKAETELNGGISDVQTTITVDDTTNFFAPVTGPDGTIDTSIKFYVRINDEIMRYEGKTGTTFTTITRGSLGTVAVTHDDGDSIESFISLTGDAITLALKILLSGKNDNFQESVAVESFLNIDATTQVTNSIFFSDIDLVRDFNLTTGDFVTTTGASNGSNDVSGTTRTVDEIVKTDLGSYLVVGGAALVQEFDSPAVADFRSQYDTLGQGLSLDPDQVDILEHERVLRLFLSGFNYEFYIKDTIQGKKFLEEQVYNPAAAFGLPRKSQFSVGMHAGPLPGTNIVTLNSDNVTNPSELILRRSTTKNFQNTVTYQFDEQELEDKFLKVVATTNADSLARINVGVKSLNITARGLRTALQGQTLANTATTRRLRKYKFGAEFIENVKVHFRTGFKIEVGDIVLVDLASLQISDIKEGGVRDGEPRLFQVDNKVIDFKTGVVSFKLTDTNFDKDARFGTISPSSLVRSATSATSIVIKESFSSVFGQNEFKKWEDLVGANIRIHNSTYSIDGNATLDQITGNTLTLGAGLGFTPAADQILELGLYDNQPENVKLIYAFWSDGTNNFADAGIPYQFF